MTNLELTRNFTYHAPSADQVPKYTRMREVAHGLAFLIQDYCPDSREKSLAFTKLEEAVMWADASIARPPMAK
jgi:hypothetical protein